MTHSFKRNTFFAALFSILGLALSLISLYQHTGVHFGFITGSSFCDFSEKISCLNVHKSRYSYLLGIPIPCLAVFFYGSMAWFSLTFLRWGDPKKNASLLFILSLFSFFFSFYLFYISYFVIKVLCPTCIAMYFVNLGLLITSYLFAKKGSSGSSLLSEGINYVSHLLSKSSSYGGLKIISLLAVWFILSCSAPKILGSFLKPTMKEVMLKEFQEQEAFPFTLSTEGLYKDYPVGNPLAKIQIVEFADYECPACRSFAPVLDSIVEKYKEKVYFIKKIFPLDNDCNPMIPKPFHQVSCFATRFAYCAGEQGKFSETHKKLMELPEIESNESKEKIQQAILSLGSEASLDMIEVQKCIQEKRYDQKILKDVSDAEKADLQGTPTVYINGKAVKNLQLLEQLIVALLSDEK